MPWSGGSYTKGNAATGGWQGDASIGIGIEADRHDTQDDDFTAGINNALAKDGQNTPTANLPMGSYKHTGVGNATAADEYLSYGQLLGASSAVLTSGTAPNYTVTLTPAPTAYTQGMSFAIIIHTSLPSSGGATLNVNGLGAKDLKVTTGGSGRRDLTVSELSARQVYLVTYEAALDSFQIANPSFGASRIAFNTTIGSASGTASIATQTCNYIFLGGRTVNIDYDIQFSLSGATSSYISFSLPFNANTASISARMISDITAVTGSDLGCITYIASATAIHLYREDNVSFPVDPTMYVRINGIYTADL